MWQKLNASLFAALIVIGQPALALAQSQSDSPGRQWYGPGPGHMWGWGDGYGFFWGGPLMFLFWIVVIGAVVYLLIRAVQRPHAGPPWADRYESDPTYSALQILNERYARGEIQKEEYEERKAALSSGARR